ncbi:MAG: response regulator transcription factor [Acidobacteria bacterium]|nr:response regulator transcription factor [Acidobacteriota bacterium]MCH8985782.1 response regulator transcription factor [Acidobacteriota bacterium]
MIRIAIADDHYLLLEGLREALNAVPDLQVVATAGDGEAFVAIVAAHRPDVLLVDIEMPKLTGIAALRKLENAPPAIVMTMHTDTDNLKRAEAAGAVGFFSKETRLPDLAAAIRAVAAGEVLIGAPDIDEILARHRQPVLDAGASALTARERELLGYLASGMSATDELAETMFISQKTVKNHLASIYEKLAITDRAQAVVEAIRLGFNRSPL